MRIAVAGGTGVVGTHVVRTAEESGHDVVVLSRSRGVDVAAGENLDPALEGADAVIDVANRVTMRAGPSARFFTDVSRHLQEAGGRAGVRHIVTLSIVGCDRVPGNGYYVGKVRQEEVVLGGPVPATVLRATQFHEFPGQVLRRSLWGPVGVLPHMRMQPVAAAAVAAELVRLAEGPPRGRAGDLGGPREEDLYDLGHRLLAHEGRRARLVPVPVPGRMGRAVAGGALLPGPDGCTAGPTFGEWLEAPGSPG